MMNWLHFLILVGCTLVAYTLGYILTETKYALSRWSLFKFKAFTCRRCLTFHIGWVSSTAISLYLNDWVMLVCGILFALMTWLGLKIDEKRKTVKLEDIYKYEYKHRDTEED